MDTFADHVIRFNRELSFPGQLPENIRILNPFRDNPEINKISEQFYRKFYNDNHKRRFIIGINPGRLGAGATGIPFTDSKRLSEICGINIESVVSHEPSSVFIYDVIEQYGGPARFYGDYYIGSMSPLGFIIKNDKGNWINCNYYDDKPLFDTMYDFIVESLKKQIDFDIDRDICFILGKKNATFFKKINDREKLFRTAVVLDHPRYIMQYQTKNRESFITHYLEQLMQPGR